MYKMYQGKVYMREFENSEWYIQIPDVTNDNENLSDVLGKFVGKDVTIVIFDKQLEKKDKELIERQAKVIRTHIMFQNIVEQEVGKDKFYKLLELWSKKVSEELV